MNDDDDNVLMVMMMPLKIRSASLMVMIIDNYVGGCNAR
jgi:hypothetical protein